MSRNLATALCASLTVLTAGFAATPAMADAMMSEAAPARVISVPKDKSLSFRLDEPATKIVVAQPDIAEVVATTDRSFYVRGIDLGSTNLLVYGPGGRLLEVIDVRVGPDAAALQQDIALALPAEHVRVSNLGQGVMLTGTVSNSGAALRAKAIAERQSPDAVTSMLKVDSTQVVLEVRILEANRSVTQDIGLGATITNGSFNFSFGNGVIGNSVPNGVLSLRGGSGHTTINAQIQALEEKGTVRTLARPNLVAMSGEKASFLAGGEFPFPVPAGNNNVTIEFRPYGVKLNFTPTIQDDGTIRLLVEPEVSALDQTNSLKLNGVTVPALTVRRANTTVQLKNGDSLAIGGLFQHGYENELRQIPGLGEIPILSALFRSTHFKRNETELLIIVTPRLQTQGDFDQAKTRTITGVEPKTFDFMVKGEALDKPMAGDFSGPTDSAAAPAPQLRGAIAPAAVSKSAVAVAPAAKPVVASASVVAPAPATSKSATASASAVAPAPKPVVASAIAVAPVPAAPKSAVASAAAAAPAPKPVVASAIAVAPVPAAPKSAVASAAAVTAATTGSATPAAPKAAVAPAPVVVADASSVIATAPTVTFAPTSATAPKTASSGK